MVANPADHGRRHDFDLADEAIVGVFALLRASLDDPEVLRSLPENAVVEFRDVDIRGHLFSLTAARGEDSDVWTARPYRHALTKPSQVWERPNGKSRGAPDPDVLVRSLRATGLSGGDALDSLTRKLLDSVDHMQGSSEPGAAAPG